MAGHFDILSLWMAKDGFEYCPTSCYRSTVWSSL